MNINLNYDINIYFLLGIITFWGEQIFQPNHLSSQVSDKKAYRFWILDLLILRSFLIFEKVFQTFEKAMTSLNANCEKLIENYVDHY